jgi:hypothetical protein
MNPLADPAIGVCAWRIPGVAIILTITPAMIANDWQILLTPDFSSL